MALKAAVRQHFVNVLRRGVHALRYDPNFVAGKKLSKKEMEQREQELNQAAEDLEEQTMTTETTRKKLKKTKKQNTPYSKRCQKILAAMTGAAMVNSVMAEITLAQTTEMIIFVDEAGFDGWLLLAMILAIWCFGM